MADPQGDENPAEPILIAKLPTAVKPPRADIDYLEHQETGVRWMLEREAADAPWCRGGILADDMGLGKTFQTIGLLKNSKLTLTTLIVCPPALVAGWAEELKRCGFRVRQLVGPGTWSSPLVSAAGSQDVWLTTYGKLCTNTATIKDGRFGRIILDEGHIIRNGKSTKRWGAAMNIARKPHTVCRWVLSATPIQNSYDDWRNLSAWLRVVGEPTAADIMLRRTMAELRDAMEALPSAPIFHTHDLTIPVTGPTATEHALFGALCGSLTSVMESSAVSALMKLELYMRIQQFLIHPQLYIERMRAKMKGAYPRPDWNGTATKWDAVMTELQTGIDRGVSQIVFCNFREEMNRVEAAVTERGGVPYAVRGGMSHQAVGTTVDAARADAAAGLPVVMIVQIVTGGAGLNLQFCSRILFLSQHWNPAVVHQAVGRAVRIGQRAVVEVHMFRVVDDVLENLDRRMTAVHIAKIAGAKEIYSTLYEGYAPLEAIPTKGGKAKLDQDGEDGEGSEVRSWAGDDEEEENEEGDDGSDVGSVTSK
jgi:SNF2 family DNA or RNA helicase